MQTAAHGWDHLLAGLPSPHFLQSYEWGQVKAQYGWRPLYATWDADGPCRLTVDLEDLPLSADGVKAAALILKRTVRLRGWSAPWSILYLPKGPTLDWSDSALRARVLADLASVARRQRAVFVKIDPDVVIGRGLPGSGEDFPAPDGESVRAELARAGWRSSAEQIQFRNTVLIDLTRGEEELLERMKQKTRYNVRLATKKGVIVRLGGEADYPMLYQMYAETSVRDGFVIRDEAYYRTVWALFRHGTDDPISQPYAEPLIAEVDGEPVAAIFVFVFAGRAYYVYGMSRDLHREKMPAYLLQWEAMRRARAAGCTVYDLWGAPDVFDESDTLWGVFRFKEGLGGAVSRTLGAWDFAPNAFIYQLYTGIMPRILDIMRSRGRSRTRQVLRD